MISKYFGIAPKGDLIVINKLGEKLKNKSFLNVNSTRSGGGVAEILNRMVPIIKDLGINARWEVIEGDSKFFNITKKIHNALQGNEEKIEHNLWNYYYNINKKNSSQIKLYADFVLIHDPQPAPLIEFKKSGIWVFRCHIDLSHPQKEIWNSLLPYLKKYNSAIFSVAKFAMAIGINEFIVPPSIDPLSEKNRNLTEDEIKNTLDKFQIPKEKPMILQVSRFDRFKDPIGVIKAYRLVKKYNDCILVLAGSSATDDPEGEAVLNEVKEYATGDPDIFILLLPPFSDKDINALQRSANVVIQKSLKEGFGLTVSEAMWKEKPVIGGAVGGIPLQIIHTVNGFLVHSIEGTAFRIRQLLNNPEMAKKMGQNGKEYVKKNFLITRQIRDYLSIWYSLEKNENILEL